MGVCYCSMFSSIAIILMGKRELIALPNLSSWCPVMVERLFLALPRCCLQFVVVVFPDHTHLLFLGINWSRNYGYFNSIHPLISCFSMVLHYPISNIQTKINANS